MTINDIDQLARRLAESLAEQTAELRLYTPRQAGEILGKTEHWVIQAIGDGRIPYTRIGKSPRLTSEHIREIAAAGEVRVGSRRAA